MTNERRKWVIDALRIHVDGFSNGSFKDDTLAIINELTSPAPSGWQQRIAAMSPWMRFGAGPMRCFFCERWAGQSHMSDCLWQNAKDAIPPSSAWSAEDERNAVIAYILSCREERDVVQVFDVMASHIRDGKHLADALPPAPEGLPAPYRCDEDDCEWSGDQPDRESDGVTKCPACGSVAIIEPSKADASPTKDPPESIADLTPEQRHDLSRCSDEWQTRLQPHRDAVRESTTLTADDLSIRVEADASPAKETP